MSVTFLLEQIISSGSLSMNIEAQLMMVLRVLREVEV